MKSLTSLIIAAAMAVFPGLAHAQNPPSCQDQPLVSSGTIVGTGKSAGLIIGVRKGTGTVTLHSGETFKITAKGFKLMEFGASDSKFVGVVYNLKNIADIEGIYTGLAAGATAAKVGFGGTSFTNTKCVVINATATDRKGLQLSMPNVGGIVVELVK